VINILLISGTMLSTAVQLVHHLAGFELVVKDISMQQNAIMTDHSNRHKCLLSAQCISSTGQIIKSLSVCQLVYVTRNELNAL